MNFSYLENVQKLVEENIYNRGVKYYLDGRVRNHSELLLDYWREYTVLGSHDYIVKIPLLHLALDSKKFSQADVALSQMVNCSCEYFQEYAICKHIVAVCASLEQEFSNGLTIKKQKINQTSSDEVLSQIFEVQSEKYLREFGASLDKYLFTSNPKINFIWIEDFALSVLNKDTKKLEFLAKLQIEFKKHLLNYDLEKKIVRLVIPTLVVGQEMWWEFWLPIFPDFLDKSQTKLYLEIYKLTAGNLFNSFKSKVLGYFQNLAQAQKDAVIDLVKENEIDFVQLVKLAFDWKNMSWLLNNQTLLEPEHLIKLALLQPAESENLELQILNKIKIWCDFLNPTGYDELIKTLDFWQKNLGRSEYFEDATNYLISSQGKKGHY